MVAKPRPAPTPRHRRWASLLLRALLWMGGLTVAAGLGGAALVAIALATAYPNLPEISGLTDYRPKLPLRVYSADNILLGEFGEERRRYTPIEDIPQIMQDAVLAVEDARFYSHSGVDYRGVLRAAIANFRQVGSQGASTITMQVARNFYLSTEKTVTRKVYEMLLAFKIEAMLSKPQILEVYMNQIFLGQRAYGFAAAAETYFGKPLARITIAEAAMLAGLPQAPSAYNPVSNPRRARARQLHIIDRMFENGYITEEQAEQAKAEEIRLRPPRQTRSHADFVAETARQLVFAQYGEEAYARGLNVYTTIRSDEQQIAYRALRAGIMDFERRQFYRGPEGHVTLPADPEQVDDVVAQALAAYPDNDEIAAAVVLEASPRRVRVMRQNGEEIVITGTGLKPAESGLANKANPNTAIRTGSVVRILPAAGQGGRPSWQITQLPEVEGAFVSMDPSTGAIRSLVGGFDYAKNKFNHVTQAWRQPGSAFKPFLYSAALEKGFTPATVINDAPLFYDADVTGSQPWEPKNYDGEFDGMMSLRRALAKSKNMVSIRLVEAIGPSYGQAWATRFGFEDTRHPAYLTIALGAGSVTPLQMAAGYSVFANGGRRVEPYLITRITDVHGRVLAAPARPRPEDQPQVIDPRNAFVMSSLLQEITRTGTAARAQATLKRPDLYGKTGTTNDAMDAWFVGFQPTVTAAVWIGYGTPRRLGARETGGGLALPVWIDYMRQVLKDVPIQEITPTPGVVNVAGEWFYEEYANGEGVVSLGAPQAVPPTPTEDERRSILDIFRSRPL